MIRLSMGSEIHLKLRGAVFSAAVSTAVSKTSGVLFFSYIVNSPVFVFITFVGVRPLNGENYRFIFEKEKIFATKSTAAENDAIRNRNAV